MAEWYKRYLTEDDFSFRFKNDHGEVLIKPDVSLFEKHFPEFKTVINQVSEDYNKTRAYLKKHGCYVTSKLYRFWQKKATQLGFINQEDNIIFLFCCAVLLLSKLLNRFPLEQAIGYHWLRINELEEIILELDKGTLSIGKITFNKVNSQNNKRNKPLAVPEYFLRQEDFVLIISTALKMYLDNDPIKIGNSKGKIKKRKPLSNQKASTNVKKRLAQSLHSFLQNSGILKAKPKKQTSDEQCLIIGYIFSEFRILEDERDFYEEKNDVGEYFESWLADRIRRYIIRHVAD